MRRALCAVVLGVVVVVIAAPVAVSAPSTERAHWRLDNRGTPRVAIDSTRFDNDGKNRQIRGNGRGYRFNGRNSRIIVPDAPSLDPRRVDFAIGVTLKVGRPPPQGETYDVLRKGLATSAGGSYKLEIKRVGNAARARCVVRDSDRDTAGVVAPRDLADGKRHTLRCAKTSRGVTIRVDNRALHTDTVDSLGRVSNAARLGIGAKAERRASTGFDWYRGRIFDAWLRVRRP